MILQLYVTTLIKDASGRSSGRAVFESKIFWPQDKNSFHDITFTWKEEKISRGYRSNLSNKILIYVNNFYILYRCEKTELIMLFLRTTKRITKLCTSRTYWFEQLKPYIVHIAHWFFRRMPQIHLHIFHCWVCRLAIKISTLFWIKLHWKPIRFKSRLKLNDHESILRDVNKH